MRLDKIEKKISLAWWTGINTINEYFGLVLLCFSISGFFTRRVVLQPRIPFKTFLSVFLKLFWVFFYKSQAISPVLIAIFLQFYVYLDRIVQKSNIQINGQEGLRKTYTKVLVVIFLWKDKIREPLSVLISDCIFWFF